MPEVQTPAPVKRSRASKNAAKRKRKRDARGASPSTRGDDSTKRLKDENSVVSSKAAVAGASPPSSAPPHAVAETAAGVDQAALQAAKAPTSPIGQHHKSKKKKKNKKGRKETHDEHTSPLRPSLPAPAPAPAPGTLANNGGGGSGGEQTHEHHAPPPADSHVACKIPRGVDGTGVAGVLPGKRPAGGQGSSASRGSGNSGDNSKDEERLLCKVLESARSRHRQDIGKGRPLVGWDIAAHAGSVFGELAAAMSSLSKDGDRGGGDGGEAEAEEESCAAVASAANAVATAADEEHSGQVGFYVPIVGGRELL